jgi:2-isopropylmalate synthase
MRRVTVEQLLSDLRPIVRIALESHYNWHHNLSVAMQEKSSVFYEAPPPQASRELAELRMSPDYSPPFQIIRRRVIDDYNEGRMTIDATVVIRIGDIEENEAARGVGVVHALDLALRKALLKYFSYLATVRVTETYMHGSGESTDAEVISVKKFTDGHTTWTTMAKSANTVEAGWSSLVDGYEWRINMENFRTKRLLGNPRLSNR